MTVTPCPLCRQPVLWEAVPTRPFCSERCRILDLGAWSSESYRLAENPAQEDGEGWSDPGEGGPCDSMS